LLAMTCYLLGALAFCAACWFSLGQGAADAQQMTSYASR
jgi:hypothetical protein